MGLWHTKWTDMSRVVRTHWGSEDEPNSMATVARLSQSRKPSDMRKVDTTTDNTGWTPSKLLGVRHSF